MLVRRVTASVAGSVRRVATTNHLRAVAGTSVCLAAVAGTLAPRFSTRAEDAMAALSAARKKLQDFDISKSMPGEPEELGVAREVVAAMTSTMQSARGRSLLATDSDEMRSRLWMLVVMNLLAQSEQMDVAERYKLLKRGPACPPKQVDELLMWAVVSKAVYENSVEDFCKYINERTGDIRQANVEPEHVLLASWKPRLHQPAHAVYLDHENKAVVVAIRGTSTVHDALTDVGFAATPFGSSYAHSGIAKSCEGLWAAAGDTVLQACIDHPGYSLKFTGHSLGAGVAALATLQVRNRSVSEMFSSVKAGAGKLGKRLKANNTLRKATCVAFATPACLSPTLATSVGDEILNVILDTDTIPRASAVAYADFLNGIVASGASQLASSTSELANVWEVAEQTVQSEVTNALKPLTESNSALSNFARKVKDVVDNVATKGKKNRSLMLEEVTSAQRELAKQVEELGKLQVSESQILAHLKAGGSEVDAAALAHAPMITPGKVWHIVYAGDEATVVRRPHGYFNQFVLAPKMFLDHSLGSYLHYLKAATKNSE